MRATGPGTAFTLTLSLPAHPPGGLRPASQAVGSPSLPGPDAVHLDRRSGPTLQPGHDAMTLRPPLAALSLLLVASGAGAQGEAPAAPAAPEAALPTQAQVRGFLDQAGPGWRARRDAGTGFVRSLWGGALAPSLRPATDAEAIEVAREFLARTEELHGLEAETLAADRAVFLPLGLAGSTDKLTVRFEQVVRGVPVRNGSANVLLDTDGRLLSLEATGLPRAAALDVVPGVPAARAADAARALFRAEEGVFPTSASEPRLVVEKERDAKGAVRGALGWALELRFQEPGYEPRAALYVMAATGAPRRLAREELLHSFDVFGTVRSFVSPGLLPDQPSNPPVMEPLAFVDVVTGLGTFTTDAAGDFVIPGVDTPVAATVRFAGPFADANNAQGADHEVNVVLQPGVQNDVLLNAAPAELVTSQANAFQEITALRGWLVGVNPTDTILDFPAQALVNQTHLQCNATFDGFGTNYFVEAAGCFNSAYSTIVYHEMGHFLNQLYGSGNGADGFGEGAADIWAMFCSDDPLVGAEFKGPGTIIRSGENTVQFCGDDGQGCYGGTHANGLPLMGAFWKWRQNLNATYGDAAGDLAADVLLNAWFNAFDDGQVLSFVEEHLLVLDDDDANVENGTPNYADIDAAFRAQGWPGFDLTYVDFVDPVLPADTKDDYGPYGVGVQLSSAMGAGIGGADVFFRVDGGPFVSLPMSPVLADFWTALIPGQPSPALVELYVSASDTLGNVQTLPRRAPEELFSFRVGVDEVFWSDDFEGPGDNGWTHVQVATQDDWQRDVPQGQSGQSFNVDWQDPAAAASGSFCWGNDLGVSGFNGAYQPEVDNSLFSPLLDLSGATDTVLSFRRWLNVERGEFDTASILLDGNVVWQNPFDVHVRDTEWTDFEVDVAGLVDGDPSVQLQFRLQTDGGLELGGWSLDDVRFLARRPTPTACTFTTYGAGLAGVLGVPSLDTGGEPIRIGNTGFGVKLKNGMPVSTAVYFLGVAPDSVPTLGGTLLVDAAFAFVRLVDGFGQSRLALPVPDDDPSLLGQDVYMQVFCMDPTTPEGFSITPGIHMVVCN